DSPAGGHHGVGGRLRAGLSRLLVRVSTGSVGPPSAGGAPRGADDEGRGLGTRSGHPELLRHARPRAAAGDPSRTGARRSAAAPDRQVAARGSNGGGGCHVPRLRHAPGGVISPLLANIFLHEVLDTWFENEVKPRLRGRVFLVRYGDDVTAGVSQE